MKIFYLVIAVLQINLFSKPPSANCHLHPTGNKLNGRTDHGTSRLSRKAAASSIQNGGVYKIENGRDSLYLTARSGQETPGLTLLKKWANHPNQLWEASKIDKGFILKPLLNEFNSITSQIDHNAHSYNVYKFQSLGKGQWIIMNSVSSLCIANGGTKSLIKMAKCNKGDKGQKWTFYPAQ